MRNFVSLCFMPKTIEERGNAFEWPGMGDKQ